ncbi:MAG: endonuclease [Thermoanaerobaculia bacterium]
MRAPLRSRLALLLPCLLALAVGAPGRAQKLSEVVASHAGPDDHEYIELFGSPDASFAALRILVVDGSVAGGPGRIATVFTPGTANGAGFWTTGYLTSTLESPTFTLLLVSGFTGAAGDDLDLDDDGTLDASPWTAVLDSVALTDDAAGSRTYSPAVLGPSFDGLGVAPGGASRFPYFRDTDAAADWKRNDADGAGLPGFTGSLAPGEAVNTPGWPTRVHSADFYASVDPTSSASLRATLHAAIKDHIRFPYFAETTDTWDILNAADEDPANPANVVDVYKNVSYLKISGGVGAYNREHSWPNSYGFSSTGSIPYTDCHHLFVSEVGYNSDRGNLPYGPCVSGCTERPTTLTNGFGGGGTSTSNFYTGSGNTGVWETWLHRRGDVARAQLYLDVRYEGGTHGVTGASEPDLVLTDTTSLIVSTSSSPAYMGRLATILQWHIDDAPDSGEVRRNDVVASYLGNRNPFIDHSEWVACVFPPFTGCAPRLADAATIDTDTGLVFEARHLNTSPQLATSWTWEVVQSPAGSTASFSSSSIRNPTFTPDAAGVFVLRLTASNAAATSISTVSMTVACVTPATPVITAPAVVGAHSPNRIASVAAHAGSLYAWTIGNGTITGGQGTAQVTFTAGVAGTVTFQVVEAWPSGCSALPASAGVNVLDAASAVVFYTLPPCRVLDTRDAAGALGGPALSASSDRVFPMTGICGIPAAARALSLNVTVTQPAAAGELIVHPGDTAAPVVSTLSFRSGVTRASNTMVTLPADESGSVGIKNGSAGTVHVIVDVNGYFQ